MISALLNIMAYKYFKKKEYIFKPEYILMLEAIVFFPLHLYIPIKSIIPLIFLYTIAMVDYFEYIIPNAFIGLYLAANFLEISNFSLKNLNYDYAFFALVILFICLLLISILSNKLGFGDVKLMLAIFITIGRYRFLDFFFLLALFTFIASLLVLFVKKSNTTIALAPYIFISYLILVIGEL